MGWRGANSHAIKNNSASNAGYTIIINANWINGRVSDWDFEYNMEVPFVVVKLSSLLLLLLLFLLQNKLKELLHAQMY